MNAAVQKPTAGQRVPTRVVWLLTAIATKVNSTRVAVTRQRGEKQDWDIWPRALPGLARRALEGLWLGVQRTQKRTSASGPIELQLRAHC